MSVKTIQKEAISIGISAQKLGEVSLLTMLLQSMRPHLGNHRTEQVRIKIMFTIAMVKTDCDLKYGCIISPISSNPINYNYLVPHLPGEGG